ncbi:MAG: C40 family peptidase [Bacteroidota bacterium]
MGTREAARRILVLVWLVATVVGCGGPSARFASPETKQDKQQRSDRPRFSSKESQEEQAEDDIKVDLRRVRERYASPSVSTIEKDAAPPVGAGLNRNAVMDEILSHIGTPYASVGNEQGRLDCSAFTALVYKNSLRRHLPRTTKEQFRVGKSVPGTSLKFGDLVFFNTTGENPSHVGMYIGDDLFAHASVTWGVTISSLQSSYFRNRYTGARRVM